MKIFQHISKQNFYLVLAFGLLFFVIHTILLAFHVPSSWCDDVFYVDLARQIGLYGSFYSRVWGYVETSCPLYMLLLAPIIRCFGMNYFLIHLPGLLLTLLSYFLLAYGLLCKLLINKWSTIALFSILYWFLPMLFWTNNSGRIEPLCLFIGISTIYCFIWSAKFLSYKSGILLFITSFLLYMSGIEGIVFALVVILSYCLVSIRKFKHYWRSVAIFIGAIIVAFGANNMLAYSQGGLSAFYARLFGRSSLANIYMPILSILKGIKNGTPISLNRPSMPAEATPDISLIEKIWNGYTLEPNYWVLFIILVICITILFILKKEILQNRLFEVISLSALLMPLIFVLAGRYTSYYTWASIVPLVLALSIAADNYKGSAYFSLIGACATMLSFFYSPIIDRRWDWHGDLDRELKVQVQAASPYIQKDWCVVLPHKWYYYVINDDENLWYYSTPGFASDLKYVLYKSDDYCEFERFDARFQMHSIDTIENVVVYQIDSLKCTQFY